MPAEPYSLGIGVEIDQKQMTDLVGQLSNALGTFGTAVDKVNDQLMKSFAGAKAEADQLANSMSMSFSKALPAGGGVTGVPDNLIDQIIGDAADTGQIEAFKKSLDPLAPVIEGLSTLTVALAGNMQRLNETADGMAQSLGILAGAAGGGADSVPKVTKVMEGLDAEVKQKPKDLGMLSKALGFLVDGASAVIDPVVGIVMGLMDVGSVIKSVAVTALDLLTFTLGKVVDAFQLAWSGVEKFAEGMRKGFEFTRAAEELEKATIRMAVGMGGGWEQADKLRDSITDLGAATGVSLTEITKLEAGLTNAGMTFTDFSSDTQKAIVSLSHNFGLSGEQIATTTATLGSFGMELGSTLDSAVAFQKGFKIPGVFEQLPELVNFARETFTSFSEGVVGSGEHILRASMGTAGAFSKAFGTTMADATKRAEQAMSHFANSAQQDQDVFLGLSHEFSGLTQTLMQVGIPLQRAMAITAQGFDDPIEAAGRFRQVLDSMPNDFMKRRFMSQLQKELPKDVLMLVKDTKLFQKTITDKKIAAAFQKTFAGEGVGAFEQMTDTLQSATMEVRAFVNNLTDLAKATFGQIGKMLGFDEVLAGARDTLKGFNQRLKEFIGGDKFRAFMQRIKPVAVALGKVFFGLGDSMMRLADGVELFFGKWVDGEKGFSGADLFDKFSKWVSGGGIEKVLLPMTQQMEKFITDHLPDMQKWAYSLGHAIGVAVGRIGNIVTDVFDKLFSDSGTKGIDQSADTWEGALSTSIANILKAIGSSVMASFRGLGDGLYKEWGITITEMGLMWEILSDGAASTWRAIRNFAVDSFIAMTVLMDDKLIRPIEAMWIDLSSDAAATWEMIKGAAHGNFSGIAVMFFDIVKKMGDKFIDFGSDVVGTTRKIVAAINEWTGGLDGVLKKMDEVTNETADLRAKFDKSIKDQVDGYKDSTAEAIKSIHSRRDEELGALKTRQNLFNAGMRMAAETQAKEEQDADEAHKKKMGQLTVQLGQQALLKAETEGREKASRKFLDEGRKGIDETLADFGKLKDAQKFGAVGVEAGSRAIKLALERSLTSIADDVQSGVLSTEDAIGQLRKAEDNAYKTGLTAAADAAKPAPTMGAGAAAQRATGPAQSAQGMTPQAMAQLLQSFKSDVRVASTVTIKGDGAVSNALARTAQVQNFNANGN